MRAKITQNSKKNVAAIVAVSLVFGIMIGLGIQTTDAQLTDPRPGAQTPKSFGSATSNIVCGDRLCSEPQQVMNIEEDDRIGEIDYNDPAAPHAEVISIDKYRPSTNKQDAITYKITYRLTGGQEDLKDIHIRATTDIGTWDFEISSLNALTSSINVARVKALDHDSITGEIIGYTVTGPADPTGQFPR